MKTILALAALGLVASPAFAQDAKVEAPPPVKLSGAIDNSAAVDLSTGAISTLHELTLTLEGKAGDITVGAEAVVGIEGDFDGGSTIDFEDPTLELYVESEKFGKVAALDTDGALDARCVTATEGSEHFWAEDIMTFNTCDGYGGQGVSYTTPDLSGFKITVSALTDLWGFDEVGDVSQSASIAASYEGEVNGVKIAASAGLDKALAVKGGLAPGQALPTLLQGGVVATVDGWGIGVSGQYEVASLGGGDSMAGAVGISKEVAPNFTLMAEAFADSYQDAGDPTREVGAGLTAQMVLVPDQVLIDAALEVLHWTSDGGVDTTDVVVGAGAKFSF